MKYNIYLTGPYTTNRIDWDIAIAQLREAGHSVVSPPDLFEGTDANTMSRKERMSLRIMALLKCDLLINLPDFEKDIDSTCEVKLARMIEMNVQLLINFCDANNIKLPQNQN